ncbi:DUF4360 domain-containing protein [Thiofilum flexile]|uniref:DUF4360 domain-containing protein n=1 Tax=Thiofilum flexile TaxID=125627 RepID=UPI00037A5304|nr:DUF4360 domain-containing protein [Thiofilum flexile]
MKSSLFSWATLIASLGFSSFALALVPPAQAANYIQTKSIDFAGSECAAASVKSSGNSEIIMAFTSWRTRGNDRSNCAISIPVKVPRGVQVGLPTVTYKGSSTPALLTSEVFFAGDLSTAKKINVRNTFTKVDQTIGWSGCGEDVNIRLNAALMTDYGTGRINSITLSKLPTRSCR